METNTKTAMQGAVGTPLGTIMPSQLKAARGLMNWTRIECGKATNVSAETIKNIEHSVFTPQEATNEKLITAFASHGVELINLVDFKLHTLSGNALDRIVNVVGAVLVTPVDAGKGRS